MITPHSPWFLRKQKLSEFHFTDNVKEVHSIVLDSAEVSRGVKLVKSVENSEGAIVKDYFGDYTSAIMTDLNPGMLKAIILGCKKVEDGYVSELGLRIPFDLEGALHPEHMLVEGSNKFFKIGNVIVSEETKPGDVLVIEVANVKRVMQHGRIHYDLGEIKAVKVDPPGMGSGIGNLDNLVSETVEMSSKFEIGDIVYSDQVLKGEVLGKVHRVLGDDSKAEIIWETGEVSQMTVPSLILATEKFSSSRILQAKRSIREEGMIVYNKQNGVKAEDLAENETVPGPFIVQFAEGHTHLWDPESGITYGQFDGEFNEVEEDHFHEIDMVSRTALDAHGHSHALTVQSPPKEYEMAEKDLDSVFKKYHELVNMSASELQKWSENECSKKASLDRSPIKRNLELLKTPKDKWTDKHITWANKTIGFISRMRKVSSGDPAVKGCPSKRDISLLNWAFDPRK